MLQNDGSIFLTLYLAANISNAKIIFIRNAMLWKTVDLLETQLIGLFIDD